MRLFGSLCPSRRAAMAYSWLDDVFDDLDLRDGADVDAGIAAAAPAPSAASASSPASGADLHARIAALRTALDIDAGDRERDDEPDLDVRVLAVGFADLCGFTRLCRTLAEPDLVQLLERFESAATLALPAAGATVVKLLGDGVLFHAPTADVAVEAASLLVTEAYADGRLPAVRAAVGVGRVVLRGGDCFGEVVNRASRLLELASPHGVVVDESVISQCNGRPFRSLGDCELRDYGQLPVWAAVS